jgi:endonuclease/exonuclease/phosphatase family metal-dependent hydrolase
VWNPFLKDAPDEVKTIKKDLKEASDHFPVSCEIVV